MKYSYYSLATPGVDLLGARHGTPSRDDPALAGRVIPYLKDLWEQA